jgi:hypothetical protein
MPKKPKPFSEQSRRFMETADEIGASATEKEFERAFRRAIPSRTGTTRAAKRKPKPKSN